MICPTCQTQNPASQQFCNVCGSPLHRSSNFAVDSFPASTEDSLAIHDRNKNAAANVCPTCQTPLDDGMSGNICPVCNSALPFSTLSRQGERDSSIQEPERGGAEIVAIQRPGRRNYGEGTIIGDPMTLPDEYRDVDPLHAVFVIILTIEVLVIMGALLLQVLIAAIIIVVILAILRNSGLTFLLSGCLSNAFTVPMSIISASTRQMIGAIRPSSNPANRRSVREYQIDPVNGALSAFVVKGNTSPRSLRKGDRVRITTSLRNGRPYLRSGYLFEHDRWIPLRISEPSLGIYWFIAFIIVNSIGVLLYLNYIGGQP